MKPFAVKIDRDVDVLTGPSSLHTKVRNAPYGYQIISEVEQGLGSKSGYGWLKNGIGWISLDKVTRIG